MSIVEEIIELINGIEKYKKLDSNNREYLEKLHIILPLIKDKMTNPARILLHDKDHLILCQNLSTVNVNHTYIDHYLPDIMSIINKIPILERNTIQEILNENIKSAKNCQQKLDKLTKQQEALETQIKTGTGSVDQLLKDFKENFSTAQDDRSKEFDKAQTERQNSLQSELNSLQAAGKEELSKNRK
jgi:hypothetical protein